MADTKKYYIEINGIKESVDAVDSLLKKLENLEQRIDALNQKGIKVEGSGGSSGGGSKSRVSDLTAEQKIIDQINRSQEKREALEGEIGKMLADEKQAMKELNAEQKSLAAKDRLAAGGYDSNTMLGMKSELADIKAAMQTMEVGSQEMQQAAQRANELNSKLLEIEKSYGQYGRNVGNYANSIKEAMQGITLTIGGQQVAFDSTKDALKTLRESIKQMTVEGKQNTDEYKNNVQALHELEMALQEADSAINDVKTSSQGMDEALDWMQSFGAMGQITQGFSAFFGNTGFEESIQKLMSLQSMLQGIEQLRKQMNTGEGFGKLFSGISKEADLVATKIMGVKGGMEGLATASKATQIAVKGLSTVLKGIAGLGIGLLIEGAMKLADYLGDTISGWLGGNDAVIDSNKAVAASIEMENKRLEEQEEIRKRQYQQGKITAEEYYTQGITGQAEAITKNLDSLDKLIEKTDEFDEKIKESLKVGIQEGRRIGTEAFTPVIKIDNIKQGTEEFEKFNDATMHHIDIWKETGKGDFLQEFLTSVKDTEQELQAINAVGFGEFKKRLRDAMVTMQENTAEGIKKVNELKEILLSNDWLNSVLNKPENLIDLPGFKAYIDQIKGLWEGLLDMVKTPSPFALEQLEIDAMKDGTEKRIAQENLRYKKEQEQWKGFENKKVSDKEGAMTVEEAMEKKHQNNLLKAQETGGAKRVSSAKHTAKQTLDIEKETQRAKLDAMADGLTKTLMKLKQERDERLKRVKGHKEAELYINQYYDKKIAEERKKWFNDIQEGYKKLYSTIFNYHLETMKQFAETDENIAERTYQHILEYDEGLVGMGYYGSQKALEKLKQMFADFDESLLSSQTIFEDRMMRTRNVYDKAAEETNKKLKEFYQEQRQIIQSEQEQTENENLNWYEQSITENSEYYDKLLNDTKEKVKKAKDEEEKLYLNGKIEEYEREREGNVLKIEDEFFSRRGAIEAEYEEKRQQLEERILAESDKFNKQKYEAILNELRGFYNQIGKELQELPVKNAWGLTNWGETNKQNKEALSKLISYKDEIARTQKELDELRGNKEITYSTWKNATDELIRQSEQLDEQIKDIKHNLSGWHIVEEFAKEIQQYYSAVSDSFQTIMGAMDDLNNYYFDLQQNALDKENELLQKKLEENEEILERHKNNVDKIEGELADARGDRRERLIDALNKEIIAQRRAQAEKEKLEKEQEKLEERQKDLDYAKEVAQYESGLRQILFQTSQAVMSAAANSWPIPAIPLMALAAATGAAQYVMAQKQVPIKKADGGILEGPSHSEGGIPVGNTGIEVEGQEFIINKRQTAANRELIEAINNGNGKLTLEDIMNVGGITNVQPLEINAPENTSLETAFVAYAQRPIVVDVREITSRQESVRNVQVLSGIR